MSPAGFPLRRDLKGCFEIRAQAGRSAKCRQPDQPLWRGSVREVSAYSTAGPALAREAAYLRRRL